ncbi:MAG TPA: hypothetical protein VNZ53_60300 [Steroidobacteraceae bacterium]|jgi:hypothetical protein|nr:hypothetical protein [Steroidobacteraceae bacterium]
MARPEITGKGTPENNLSDDILWGVGGPNGIAHYLGLDTRRAYYLIGRGAIPVRRLGRRTITASKKELCRLFGSAS